MTDKRLNLILCLLIGVAAASVVALTTDQIMNNVYDAAHTALRANIVAGGSGSGFISGTLTSGKIPKATGATTLGDSSVSDDGTTVSTTEAASVGALTYNGVLTQSDVHSNTTSTTIAHEVEICGSGASVNVTMTSPSSPALGATYKLVQENASHTCIFAPGGSTTIDSGATTVTLSAGVALSKDEVCVATTSGSSAVWHCTGAGS